MMKVIDIHTHVAYAPVYPKRFLDELAADLAGAVPGLYQGSNADKIQALMRGLLKDEHCDQLVRQMDKAGVERAVLLIIDAEFGMGKAGFDIERIF